MASSTQLKSVSCETFQKKDEKKKMKNNSEAQIFYEKAIECYSLQQYCAALKQCNQTLRFATDSQLLSDAFVMKAKIYNETKYYRISEENFQFAIGACVDEKKSESIKLMQVELNENITSKPEENKNFLKLLQPAHKKIPFISESLEVLENDLFGRYIATTKDLNPGDIVVMEEPFYKVLDPKMCHTRCGICLKQNLLNLFPCGKCSKGL